MWQASLQKRFSRLAVQKKTTFNPSAQVPNDKKACSMMQLTEAEFPQTHFTVSRPENASVTTQAANREHSQRSEGKE